MNTLRSRRPLILVAGLLTIGCIGCSHEPDVLAITPDVPTLGTARPARPWISSLVVSTERWIDLNLASGDDGTVLRPTGYLLYDEQGVRIRYVRNYIGATDTEPMVLDLPPGRYLVRPDKPYTRPPVFWVVVEAGKTTEVDLRK
jgi:hypothetical protein